MDNFQSFQLLPALEKALTALGFTKPTPIQEKAIPVGLAGKDVIGCAQTGTGKTAAYCLPIAMHLMKNPDATALILAPTRELVQQIEEFWRNLSKFAPGLGAVSLIGGASIFKQLNGLQRRPRLIIATPGRLLDHLKRKTANLSKSSILVLDEADRMLDMGFAPQLAQILRFVPTQRQTLLFTATWDGAMDQLSKKVLKEAVRVSAGEVSRAASLVNQFLVSTTSLKKNDTLLDELNARKGSVLVFARTKSRTDRVAKYLSSYGVNVDRIHGGRSQGQRNSALREFRNGKVRVLVATDIASRGIDVTDIAHVINYDLPMAPEDYIHRIGRTGRAGATGEAISLVTPEDRGAWKQIARLLEKTGSNVPAGVLPQQSERAASTQEWRRPRYSGRSNRY